MLCYESSPCASEGGTGFPLGCDPEDARWPVKTRIVRLHGRIPASGAPAPRLAGPCHCRGLAPCLAPISRVFRPATQSSGLETMDSYPGVRELSHESTEQDTRRPTITHERSANSATAFGFSSQTTIPQSAFPKSALFLRPRTSDSWPSPRTRDTRRSCRSR